MKKIKEVSINLLKDMQYTTRELANMLNVSQQTIFYHLRKLGIRKPRAKKAIIINDLNQEGQNEKNNQSE